MTLKYLYIGWRWCFWLNLIYGGVWLPIYVFLLPSIPSPFKSSVMERTRRLDFLGFFLWAGALCCLVAATALGGSLFPWGSSTVIGLYIGSGVGWAAFLVQQTFHILTTKEDRLFPAKFLKSWEMCILFVQMASAAAVLFISICKSEPRPSAAIFSYQVTDNSCRLHSIVLPVRPELYLAGCRRPLATIPMPLYLHSNRQRGCHGKDWSLYALVSCGQRSGHRSGCALANCRRQHIHWSYCRILRHFRCWPRLLRPGLFQRRSSKGTTSRDSYRCSVHYLRTDYESSSLLRC